MSFLRALIAWCVCEVNELHFLPADADAAAALLQILSLFLKFP